MSLIVNRNYISYFKLIAKVKLFIYFLIKKNDSEIIQNTIIEIKSDLFFISNSLLISHLPNPQHDRFRLNFTRRK